MPQHISSTELDCPAAALRLFLGRPANLPLISDPDLELQIIAAPETIAVGTSVQFRITALGFKQRTTNAYVEVTDSTIVEQQTDGPMKAWRQAQKIESLDDRRCRLTDEVTFERPGGMLGFVLTEARVRESLEQGMACRYAALKELVASGTIA